MKKLVLIVTLSAFCLCACNSKSNNKDSKNDTEQVTNTASTEAETIESTANDDTDEQEEVTGDVATSEQSSADQEDTSSVDTKSKEATSDEVTDESEASEDTLDSIVKKLSDKGLLKGEETEVMYQLIGAINGTKYVDSKIELYEYDTESDAYKGLVETGEVELEGFNMTLKVSAIKGKFVLFCEDAPNKDDIVAAFNE
jgi:hypothetical protein